MKEIWKFPLISTERQAVDMPPDARILSVQKQGEILCLWALVDPKAVTRTTRIIEVTGTGLPMPPRNREFISTVQDGVLVLHIFEITQ